MHAISKVNQPGRAISITFVTLVDWECTRVLG